MNEPETAEAPRRTQGAENRHSTPSTESSLSPYVLPTGADFPARIRLSPTADAYLERVADCLVLGVYGLERLQGGLLALVLAGDRWNQLETSRLRERVARLEAECDRLWWQNNNPGKTGAHYLAMQTDFLWAEGVAA